MANKKQLSPDDQAAAVADKMLKSGQGDLPLSQVSAEGGFTDEAGGQVMTASTGVSAEKSAHTGADITGEPGRQGMEPYTSERVTSAPKGDDGGTPDPGEGGNLDQEEDEETRARKKGKIGIQGSQSDGEGEGQAGAGGNLDQTEDDTTRARKPGTVGMSKAQESEDEDEEEEEEDSVKMVKKGYKKSEVAFSDLMKSLDTLEAVASGINPPVEDRRTVLASKLVEEGLSKSETAEFHQILGQEIEKPEDVQEENVEKSFQEQFASNDQMKQDYDISPFLETHSQLTAAALDQVQESMNKSQERETAYNTQLAKSLQGVAKLLQKSQEDAEKKDELFKSLQDRLEVVENTPLTRKSAGNVRALQKSMPNEVGSGGSNALNREQILETLDQMAMRSPQAPCGESLDRAVAMFENGGSKISKSLYNDVMTFRQGGEQIRVN